MENKEVNSYKLKIRFLNKAEQSRYPGMVLSEIRIYESDSKSVLLGIVEKISVNNEYSYTIEETTKKWDNYLKCYEIESIEVIEEGRDV